MYIKKQEQERRREWGETKEEIPNGIARQKGMMM